MKANECFECGSDYMIENHHVVPRSVGGTKTIPLCVICHGKVHDRNFVKHRELQRNGIEKAKRLGKYKGRGNGTSEYIETFLNKPKTKLIIKHLNAGESVRRTALLSKCSTGLVQKVKKIKNELTEELG